MAYHGSGSCSSRLNVAEQQLGAHRRPAGGDECDIDTRSAQATVTRMGRDCLRARVAVGH